MKTLQTIPITCMNLYALNKLWWKKFIYAQNIITDLQDGNPITSKRNTFKQMPQ